MGDLGTPSSAVTKYGIELTCLCDPPTLTLKLGGHLRGFLHRLPAGFQQTVCVQRGVWFARACVWSVNIGAILSTAGRSLGNNKRRESGGKIQKEVAFNEIFFLPFGLK